MAPPMSKSLNLSWLLLAVKVMQILMLFCHLLTVGLRQGGTIAGHASQIDPVGYVSRQFLAVIHGDYFDSVIFN